VSPRADRDPSRASPERRLSRRSPRRGRPR
jgi:hypothetical protein